MGKIFVKIYVNAMEKEIEQIISTFTCNKDQLQTILTPNVKTYILTTSLSRTRIKTNAYNTHNQSFKTETDIST